MSDASPPPREPAPSGPPLRYGLQYLWPSEIAEQFYCEYKVHLHRLHPEVRLEMAPLERGEASHAALAGQAEPVTAAQIEEAIQAGKQLALCEWVLEGTFAGVRIRGRPDVFAFAGKTARLVLDFKFSAGQRPFRDQAVQAETYAVLAASVGFAADELCFGIVLFPTSGLTGREAARAKEDMLRMLNEQGALARVYERCEQARQQLLRGQMVSIAVAGVGWKAFLYRYDPARAARNLRWALDFWLGERGPLPVGELPWDRWPRKCFACPFNAAGLCEYALQAPDPAFTVQRRPDGTVFVFR